MRYNAVAYLGTDNFTFDTYHNQVPAPTWRKVYANKYRGNLQLQQQAGVNDGRKIERYSIRSLEYSGELKFKIDTDTEIWTVTDASDEGDDTVLTVEKELGNNGTQ